MLEEEPQDLSIYLSSTSSLGMMLSMMHKGYTHSNHQAYDALQSIEDAHVVVLLYPFEAMA